VLALLKPLDLIALGLFAFCWLAYEPVLVRLGRRGGHAINTNMHVIRTAWMSNMARRENRLVDGALLGNVLNSASFFASSNLILIAAVASALFSGETAFRSASSLVVLKTSTRALFELQLGLVLATLARGLLDYIWAIRQLNYAIAAIGAVPPDTDRSVQFGAVIARLLDPALSSFNAGARGYYFALAGAAWLFGPVPFIVATLGAVGLLLWRQRGSRAAGAIADLRKMLEDDA
jgi:uncharacterized membrane protein